MKKRQMLPWPIAAVAVSLCCGDTGLKLKSPSGGSAGKTVSLPGQSQVPEPEPGTYPEDAAPEQIEALKWVNYHRGIAGLPPVIEIAEANEAAQSHAEYIAKHQDLYSDPAEFPYHNEKPGTDGFLAETYWDRLAAAGYDGDPLGEVVSLQPAVAGAVQHWIAAPYHRLVVLHPDAGEIGFGLAVSGDEAVNVLDAGAAEEPALGPVRYPPASAADVPTSWDGNEVPAPPAPPDGFPSGPAITIAWPHGAKLSVAEEDIRLLDSEGQEVSRRVVTPNNDPLLASEAAVILYADAPLALATKHVVRIEGSLSGAPFLETWWFVTVENEICDPFGADCVAGFSCYGASALTQCAFAGGKGDGKPCKNMNDCMPGSTCVSGTCRRYCGTGPLQPAGIRCPVICDDGWLEFDPARSLGTCNPPECDPLDQASCAEGQACYLGAGYSLHCDWAGSAGAGETCAGSAACAPGNACASFDGSLRCHAFCPANSCGAECGGDWWQVPESELGLCI
jgi:uncharacterized protein YkwD